MKTAIATPTTTTTTRTGPAVEAARAPALPAVVPPRAAPPRPRRPRRWLWPALGLLALGAGGALWGPSLLLGPTVPATAVARADVVRSLVAAGRIQTPHRSEIGSQVTGTAAAVLVERGDRVERGQPLLRLEDREARAALAQAEASVAQAEARLREIRDVTSPVAEQALLQSRATLDNARRAFERQTQLRAGGFAPQTQVDEARRALDVAEAGARAAQAQAEGAREGGIARALAETQLRQSRAALEVAAARLRYSEVAAPAPGVIIARNVQPGDVVQPGRALLVLAPDGPTEAVIQLDERNLSLIEIGQAALVSADARPQERFGARVSFIAPSVDPQRGAVEVKLLVPDPPAYLRQDMTVSVDIEAARSPAALVLPLTLVRDANGPRPWALRLDPETGRAERRDLRLGLRGSDRVEVRGGLAEGDLVLPPSSSVREGGRARAVAP